MFLSLKKISDGKSWEIAEKLVNTKKTATLPNKASIEKKDDKDDVVKSKKKTVKKETEKKKTEDKKSKEIKPDTDKEKKKETNKTK